MTRLRSFATAAATLTITALALTACGTTSVDEAGPDVGESTSETCATDTTTTSTDPVSMVDGVGRTVELDKPAERVAVLEWQQMEDILTLCISPVAVSDAEGYSTYVSAETLPEDVTDIGTRGEPDFDALYATNPDLIVIEAYSADDEIIGQLEERDVPVLVTVGADGADQIGNMKNVFSMIAEATGRTERADEVIDQFDAHLVEAKEKLSEVDLSTTDFLFFDGWIEGGNTVIRPYGKGALFTQLGEQLGLTPAWTDEIDEKYGSGGVDPSYGLGQTDIEGLVSVGEAILIHSGAEEEDSYVDELEKSPIWESLPAVKEGRSYTFPAGVWGAGGPLSNMQAIDAFVEILTQG